MKIQGFLKFGQEPQFKEEDEVIKIGLPSETEVKSDGDWTPAEFLVALLDPYLPRYEKNLEQEFFLYKNFLLNMNLNPNFYRYVVKETKNLKWMKNHRKELAYLLLLDILSANTPTIKTANVEYDEDYREEDRTRQRRLLRNEYYPELFFKPAEYLEIRRDEREKHYSTVVTENMLDFGEEYMSTVPFMWTLNQQFTNNLPLQKELDHWDYLNTCIRIVSADEIRDLIKFGDELNEALDRVLLRVKELDGDRKFIVDEIRERTDLVEQFRAILNTAIYVRWFNKKTMSQREKLLEKKRRLLYSESEAQKIVPLLLEYYQDPELVIAYIYFGEQAFKVLKKPKYANLLNQERKKLETTNHT